MDAKTAILSVLNSDSVPILYIYIQYKYFKSEITLMLASPHAYTTHS